MVFKFKISLILLIFILNIFTSLPVKADIAPPPLSTFKAYINKKGHIIIPTPKQIKEYNKANSYNVNRWLDYNEGLKLKVGDNNKYGFIDENENWVIEPKFPAVHCYGGIIHTTKDPYCSSFTVFNEGLAAINYEETPRVLSNKERKSYDAVFDVEKEKGVYYTNEVYGEVKDDIFHIKLLTKMIEDENSPYKWPTYKQETLTAEKLELKKKLVNGHFHYKFKTGYIDKTGKIVFDASQYYNTFPFSDGLALVNKSPKGRYGYIDKTGKMVIRNKFYSASPFKNGIAKVTMYTEELLKPFFILVIILIIFASISIKQRKTKKDL